MPERPFHDATPRLAVATSYTPEWLALRAELDRRGIAVETRRMNGIDFATATIGATHVVIYLSGMSMVNGAMAAQLLLDRYNVTAIVLTGIAGSADPALNVGDVILPARGGNISNPPSRAKPRRASRRRPSWTICARMPRISAWPSP